MIKEKNALKMWYQHIGGQKKDCDLRQKAHVGSSVTSPSLFVFTRHKELLQLNQN